MTKKIALITHLIIGLAGTSLASADDICFNISGSAGQLMPGDCVNDVWPDLRASGKFPDIFPKSQPAHVYDNACFVSVNPGIPAVLGDKQVTISSKSAWTTPLSPNFPVLGFAGTDHMASVVTKWTVAAAAGVMGTVYTVDAIDVSGMPYFTELNAIVGGTGSFSGAKGTIRIDSMLDFGTGLLNIEALSGSLCIHR